MEKVTRLKSYNLFRASFPFAATIVPQQVSFDQGDLLELHGQGKDDSLGGWWEVCRI
jgi:hypothetical protein